MVGYIYWHFWLAPVWLIKLLVVVERYYWRWFSVPLMITTFFAPWRRDRMSLQQGTISGFFHALASNTISRLVAMIIRTATLTLYSAFALTTFLLGMAVISLFIASPVVIVLTILWSLQIIVTG